MEFESGRHFRSSLRSRTSSSLSDVDAREKIKDCCRTVIAFMCTQVGVGGLIVGYTILGAFAFKLVEENAPVENYKIDEYRYDCLQDLWNISSKENTVDEIMFRIRTNTALISYQKHVVMLVHQGYKGRLPNEAWSFPAALMFSLSIITMIGYGNTTPKSTWGKSLTVIYAIFGIPLYILYFMNMGQILADCFRWIYTWLYRCSQETKDDRRIVVPSSASLWVIGLYILTGALLFSHWEGWKILDSTYFCVTSLCKIGFGDFVPGANIMDSKSGSQTKLVINFIYMLVGLGLVAMCYNLMREELRVKIEELNEDIGQCLEDTQARFVNCCARCGFKNY